MTTRKYNAIKKHCRLSAYPETFAAVYNAAVNQLGSVIDTMTATQIARLMEFGYTQHTNGMLTADD